MTWSADRGRLATAQPALVVDDLVAGYGLQPVLRGVSLTVAPGEIVAVLGRNGAGRSTLLKALMGLVPSTGRLEWRGQSLQGWAVHRRARAGLGYVPEQRDIFPGLTVQQNLTLGLPGGRARHEAGAAPGWTVEGWFQRFPWLAERRAVPAGALSGGEQQVLALGRTLMGRPSLLLADEPTEGLAPQRVDDVAAVLRELGASGVAVLLVEQKLGVAPALAARCLVMGHGRVVYEGTPAALDAAVAVRREWLEL